MVNIASVYNFASDTLALIKLCSVIVLAFLLYDYIVEEMHKDDDPDGWA